MDRDMALAALQHVDYSLALSVASKLISDPSRALRARAAWILADSGQPSGAAVLRALASEESDESVLAIESLGRLRDPMGHSLLLEAFRKETSRPRPDLGRLYALVQAIGDYEDPNDASIIAAAIRGHHSPADWVVVDAVGRTSGAGACTVLEEIFESASGWTAVSAGLGLARCGSPLGVQYVQSRLSDPALTKPEAANATAADSATDDARGLRGTDFLLDRIGAAADERFIPTLLELLDRPGVSWRARAKSWRALVRIGSTRFTKEILERAYREPNNEFAVKYVVLHDESSARKALAEHLRRGDDYGKGILREALEASAQDRRRWREIHGYAF
jgi:HEAT repeat protein